MQTTNELIREIQANRLKQLTQMDENADAAIKTGVITVIGAALVPAHVNWALTATAMGSMCAGIGICYGVKIDNDKEGKDLVKQFIYGAGFWFLAMNVGSKIFAALAETTGIGYSVGVTIDATASAAFAYAIGKSAKVYFHNLATGRKISPQEIGATTFKTAFKEYKKVHVPN